MKTKGHGSEAAREIRKRLHISDPSFETAEGEEELPELQVDELRTFLLRNKSSAPDGKPLVRALRIFHDAQFRLMNQHNALAKVLISDAVMEALVIEKRISESGSSGLPLYGYVLALDQAIEPKYCAFEASTFHRRELSQSLMAYLISRGAVILSKGNDSLPVFSSILGFEKLGAVANPLALERSAGGFSAGCAALLKLNHVNAAVSLTKNLDLVISASFCGLYALRFTAARVPGLTNVGNLEDPDFRLFGGRPELTDSGFGVLTRTLPDLTPLARELLNLYTITPAFVPVCQIRLEESGRPVKVGVLAEWDNLFELPACNRRALQTAIQALQHGQLTTVVIDIRSYITELLTHCFALYLVRQTESSNSQLAHLLFSEDPALSVFSEYKHLMLLPKSVLQLFHFLTSDLKRRIMIGSILLARTFNILHIQTRLAELGGRLIREMRSLDISVLLCPGFPPAPFQREGGNLQFWLAYSIVWQVLGWPCGFVPTTQIFASEERYNSRFSTAFERSVRRNLIGAQDLPVGVQVVGLPWHEMEVLGIMKLIPSFNEK